MPAAAKPVNSQSTALGVYIRKVFVEQVVPERGMVIVRDEQGFTTQVPYRVQPGRGRLPREGDWWYVDRSMGPWVLSSYIATDDSDLNTFDGGLEVNGTTTLNDGLNAGSTYLREGLFVEEGISAQSGYIEEGVFINGSLHVVNGITLPVGSHISRGVWFQTGMSNGWSNYGNGFQPVAYCEMPDNTVRVTGVCAGGTATEGSVIFTLPVEVRPAFHHTYLCATNDSPVQIRVNSTGTVSIQQPIGTVSWISLEGISWHLG